MPYARVNRADISLRMRSARILTCLSGWLAGTRSLRMKA